MLLLLLLLRYGRYSLNPPTKLSGDCREPWIGFVLELCYIHMIAPYPDRNVAREDSRV